MLEMFEIYMTNYIPGKEPPEVVQDLIMQKDAERGPTKKRYRKKQEKLPDRLAWLNAIGASCNLPRLTSRGMMGNKNFDRDIWVLKGKGKGEMSESDRERLVGSFYKRKPKSSATPCRSAQRVG